MRTILTIDKISKEFGQRQLLKDVSFHVNEGDRMGLVGDNGTGKTTLIKILMGQIEADSGQMIWHLKGMRVGYLSQSVEQQLDDWEKLSGGERTKRMLVNIWKSHPQLLVLDEPTNHMDQAGVQWLIKEIRRFQGSVLVISHDRYFLDQVTDRILEIERGKVENYRGNYTTYRKEKNHRMEAKRHQFREQEKTERKIDEEIRKLRTWSAKGHRESRNHEGFKEKYRARAKKKDKQVKSQIHRLEKLKREGLQKPMEEQRIVFDFQSDPRGGKRIVEAKEISKAFGRKTLFANSSFTLLSGEGIGLVGSNGCGKTTFLKCLLQEVPLDHGQLRVSESAKIATLHQDVLDLEEDQTVLAMFDIQDREKRGRLQTLLTNMGFTKPMMNQRIGDLSLGERTRLKVAEMIVSQNNLLILDEPTNHLDLHSRERLEQTLESYTGTLLVVSHDRYFLEKVCDKLLVFESGRLDKVESNYEEYMQAKEQAKDKKALDEGEKLRLGTQIAEVLSRLSLEMPGSDKYVELEVEFERLLEEKRKLG